MHIKTFMLFLMCLLGKLVQCNFYSAHTLWALELICFAPYATSCCMMKVKVGPFFGFCIGSHCDFMSLL